MTLLSIPLARAHQKMPTKVSLLENSSNGQFKNFGAWILGRFLENSISVKQFVPQKLFAWIVWSQKYILEMIWPAWVYCTRYSDRPSAGPRAKRTRKKEGMSSISYSIEIQAKNPFSSEIFRLIVYKCEKCVKLKTPERNNTRVRILE